MIALRNEKSGSAGQLVGATNPWAQGSHEKRYSSSTNLEVAGAGKAMWLHGNSRVGLLACMRSCLSPPLARRSIEAGAVQSVIASPREML